MNPIETGVPQSRTADRPQIECDIHDLLDEANVMLLSPSLLVGPGIELIGRLRNCAGEAMDAALVESAERMNKAADQLERRLLKEP